MRPSGGARAAGRAGNAVRTEGERSTSEASSGQRRVRSFILRMMVAAVLAALPLLLCAAPAEAARGENGENRVTIDLESGWQFRRVGDEVWHGARVPGCVHVDLLANGLIDDPFYRDNEALLQWIEREDWEYRCTVTAGDALVAKEHIEIVFEGLDTYARVYLNGSLAVEADNMFCTWKADCTGLLETGTNEIVVRFFSPPAAAAAEWEALPCELPGGPRVVTRKAAYHYGWDWGPRFVTCGIWRPVRLHGWSGAVIEEIHVVQTSLTADLAALDVRFEIESARGHSGTLAVSLSGEPGSEATIPVRLHAGRNDITCPVAIREPKLWWTNGLGEPHLYELRGTLSLMSGETDERSVRIGLRTVEVMCEGDEVGTSFSVRLNGLPVFMKGANVVPLDNFASRVTPDRYRSLIASAREANMNMLRVWGGGIYENDLFYDLCDENGILVWQDFMFACAMYPWNEEFIDNVTREAEQNVKRLRNHPCLALWCGNNEIEEGWRHWGWREQLDCTAAESAAVWEGYVRIFHELLPRIVATHDPGRFYWPSSPQHGRADPRSLREGDAHDWRIWHDGEPFEAFIGRAGRFVSEYGFQSYPEPATVETFTAPGDRRLESPVMRAHQKHPRGDRLIREYMERWYRVPEDFADYLYASQVLQGEGMKVAIEAHRRAMPRCMGSLYWQFNDCWPAISWSSIDYGGRWKALHYIAREAFRPLLVSPVVEEEMLNVYIVSDIVRSMPASLRIAIVTFAGEVRWEDSRDIVIEGNASRCYYGCGLERLTDGIEPQRTAFRATVVAGGECVARNHLYFLPPRELALPAATISRSVRRAEGGYTIELSSDALARRVYLSAPGGAGGNGVFFSDNFFDLFPGDTVRIACPTAGAGELDSLLRIISLVDTYRDGGAP